MKATIEADHREMTIMHVLRAVLFLVKVAGTLWLADIFGVIDAVAGR